MARIIVHSGLAKTGTSALQKWFHAHQEELSRQGVWYPSHGLAANGVSIGNLGRIGHPAEEKLVEATLQEFEERDEDTLLLSSEFFGPQIGTLSKLLPEGAKFIIYVRDPLEVLESDYNQQVKRAGLEQKLVVNHEALEDLKPKPEDQGGWLGHMHLSRAVSEIEAGDELVARPYHPALFVGGSIVSDFLHAAGIKVDPALLEEGDSRAVVNPSYTLHALEYMRTANHFDLGGFARDLDSALQSCQIGPAKYTLLSEGEYARLRQSADRYLATLRDDLGLTSLESLRAELEHQGQTKPFVPQEIDEEDIMAVGAYLRDSFPAVWQQLGDIVEGHPDVGVPYRAFRGQFVEE